MKRSTTDDSGDSKKLHINSENYNVSYGNYAGTTSMATTNINQPLPGQPPLPPMPPPTNAPVPPPPHIFSHGISSPVSLQAWTHHAPPFAPPWQWMMHQAAPQPAVPIAPQSAATPNFSPREMQPVRANFNRRERQNWNNNYNAQRNNFHRKNRRMAKTDQGQNQFDIDVYNMAAATNPNLFNNIAMLLNRNRTSNASSSATRSEETNSTEQEAKEDVINVKRLKHRKPMSLSYPRRPWNREHAERALNVEMEYNRNIKAQSLIIKFPDPDLNKDIVRNFHPGIQNIHFQSPSGPRYCFIQMAENVNIDEAIKELEQIKFGVGHLKVERKSLRDEDNTSPEEIDPYTLYIGNLPESVNVNEVKSKFPTAVRIDVGYAQKMRNTRYAFIKYNSVDESIEAYKAAHDLMWDTRSIIVRFLRQRGNTSLPGETKGNAKKTKENANLGTTSIALDKSTEGTSLTTESTDVSAKGLDAQQENNVTSTDMAKSDVSSETADKQPGTTEKPSAMEDGSQNGHAIEDVNMIMEIKEEPAEYEEMEDNDDDDDDDENDEDDENVNSKWRILIPKIGYIVSEDHISTSDHLDEMFTDLEHAVDDIDW